MTAFLHPSPQLLVKLGSIAVHADEALSDDGHPFDIDAVKHLLSDPEVQTWIWDMQKQALLPLKRSQDRPDD